MFLKILNPDGCELIIIKGVCKVSKSRYPNDGKALQLIVNDLLLLAQVFIRRARAGPGISAVTILSRQNILNKA
jgi:hypothetical protein